VSGLGVALVAVVIAVGIAGVVVPVLPGAILVWAAIALWAVVVREPEGWAVLGVATVAVGATQVLKYVIPGRRFQNAGIPLFSMLLGLVGAILGFVFIPVIGILVGFPVGILVGELLRLRDLHGAWLSTRAVLAGIGLSIVIELAGALLATAAWVAGVVVT
jgi:uncharacterized protein YqgC (DUF456 family)